MDMHAAFNVLIFGCFVLQCLSILNRVSTQRMIARHNRAITQVLRRLGKTEGDVREQGDDIARLSGEVHELRLDGDAWRQPTADRLGIDVRGVG